MDIIEALVIIIIIICVTLLGICYIYKDYVSNEIKESDKNKKNKK